MKVKNALLSLLAAAGMMTAAYAAPITAEFYASKGNAEKQFDDMMNHKIEEAGFSIMKANKHIENFYYEKYKAHHNFFGHP